MVGSACSGSLAQYIRRSPFGVWAHICICIIFKWSLSLSLFGSKTYFHIFHLFICSRHKSWCKLSREKGFFSLEQDFVLLSMNLARIINMMMHNPKEEFFYQINFLRNTAHSLTWCILCSYFCSTKISFLSFTAVIALLLCKMHLSVNILPLPLHEHEYWYHSKYG